MSEAVRSVDEGGESEKLRARSKGKIALLRLLAFEEVSSGFLYLDERV
jgi:hypothetical protein